MHPAVFASADGEGRLDVWNLNMDTEVRLSSAGGGGGGGRTSYIGLPWFLTRLQS